MKVSFDFDGTIERTNIQSIANTHIKNGDEVFIITRRCPDESAEVYSVASKLGIPIVKGYKWGDQGKCYIGPNAEEKARIQGVAEIVSGYKMSEEKVSFDYDGVLTKLTMKNKAKELMKNGVHVFIISSRHERSNLIGVAKSLGIPESRVYTTGSNKAKLEKIISLNIGTHYDNNPDVIKSLENTNTKGVKV